jgi:glycosyltransferase involved in cell wall biosynthesis
MNDRATIRCSGGMSRPSGEPVVVAFPFVGGFVGGSHLSAAKLIQQLDRRRYQPLVLLHRAEGQVADMFRDGGIAFEAAPSARFLNGASLRDDLTFLLTQTLRLARLLRDRGARIVHTNDGHSHATWALPTRLAGARLLWHHRKDPDAKGLRYVAPWAADRVISVSRFAAPRPGLLSPARKCTVVHSPFDTDAAPVDRGRARRRLVEELRCPPDARVVGFFGSLVTRKRPLLFVDAIAEMRARAPRTCRWPRRSSARTARIWPLRSGSARRPEASPTACTSWASAIRRNPGWQPATSSWCQRSTSRSGAP